MDKEAKKIKQVEYEIGLKVRKIIGSFQFKENFVTPKEMIRELYYTGKNPKDLIGKRYLVEGYGFVKKFVCENPELAEDIIKIINESPPKD